MADQNPVKTLDTQIVTAGNSIIKAIQSSYGTEPNDTAIITNPTATLHRRYPANKINMPTKACKIDFLASSNDLNLEKNIKSMSLDPIMKRLIQEKNDILRAIEGWVASQANDGARQPLLATTIGLWIKKAVEYMRCGMKVLRQINTLVNGMMQSILSVIGAIEAMVASDLRAANSLMNQMNTMGDQLEKEGVKLVTIGVITFAQDPLALYNEIESVEKELIAMKDQFSKSHLNAMKETLINSFLALIDSFRRTMNRINKNKALNVSLQASLVSLQASLDEANSLDLTVPLNPGGLSMGGLSNFSITNDPVQFPDHDSLTKTTTLISWDKAEIKQIGPGYVSEWVDIFNSKESGYLVIAANDYGLFQLGLDFNSQARCPGSAIIVRLVLNGGDWIIDATITGEKTRDKDDPNNKKYATKNGVFTAVPQAPNSKMKMKATFDEVIRAANRPDELNNLTTISDPFNPGQMIPVPDRDLDYVLKDTLPPGLPWETMTDVEWYAINNSIYRWPTQEEIDFYEQQYTTILQTLNITPKLYTSNTAQDLALTIYHDTITNTDIILHFRMPDDTQLSKALLGKRPFGGIKIFTNSINFQLSRQATGPVNIPFFVYQNDPIRDEHVVNFGMKADWGFAPVSLMS